MDLNNIVITIISFFTGGGLLFLITIPIQKKKIRAEYEQLLIETRSNELNNVDKAISIWRTAFDEMYARMLKRIGELEAEVTSLKQQISKTTQK